MDFKKNLLLLTCAFAVAQIVAADVSSDDVDAETRSKNKKYDCLTVKRQLYVCGNEDVAGTLTVNNAVANALSVLGALTVAGTETISGNLDVGGNFALTGTAVVGGNLVLSGTSYVGGSEFVHGNLTIRGNEAIGGSLTVTGTVTAVSLINAAVGLTATAGNIVATSGNITFDPTGAAGTLNALGSLETIGARMIWAEVAVGSTFTRNSGFSTVATGGTGVYTLTFATPFTNTPVIIVTPVGAGNITATVASLSDTGCVVNTFAAGTATNEAFDITVIGL